MTSGSRGIQRWDELEDARLRANAFMLDTIPDRLERDGDPWEAIGS
jgi:DNA primase